MFSNLDALFDFIGGTPGEVRLIFVGMYITWVASLSMKMTKNTMNRQLNKLARRHRRLNIWIKKGIIKQIAVVSTVVLAIPAFVIAVVSVVSVFSGMAPGSHATDLPEKSPTASEDHEITATQLYTFMPSPVYDQALKDRQSDDYKPMVACWERSYASVRTDGRYCVETGPSLIPFVHDPCFLYKDKYAVCPSVGDIISPGTASQSFLAEIAKVYPPPERLSMDGLVSVNEANKTRYPWAIKLSHKDPKGNNYICQSSLNEDNQLTGMIYNCSSATYVAISQEGFLSGKNLKVEPELQLYAASLDKSNAVWKVQFTDTRINSLVTASVLEAWF